MDESEVAVSWFNFKRTTIRALLNGVTELVRLINAGNRDEWGRVVVNHDELMTPHLRLATQCTWILAQLEYLLDRSDISRAQYDELVGLWEGVKRGCNLGEPPAVIEQLVSTALATSWQYLR